MPGRLATLRVLVDGMTCGNCEQRIERAVGALTGVNRVSASAPLGEVMVYYDPALVSAADIHEAVRAAGYSVRDVPAAEALPAANALKAAEAPRAATDKSAGSPGLVRFLGLLAIVAAVYFILKYTVGLTFLPTVSQSMGYGLIFVVGLLTSLHCIAMCGGIVLTQGIRKDDGGSQPPVSGTAPGFRERLLPSLLYNGGRVISYTLIGGIVGALGSLFSLSTTLRGVMPVLAGAFMFLLGVRMLGVFPRLSRIPIRFPRFGGNKLNSAAARRGPLVVGLLNGLMPCGPLQTMQVYALGTGSFLGGALSMFLFSVGTVPLLLGFGAISTLLSARFNRGMVRASGVLVLVLGLVMFGRGMNLFGVALPGVTPSAVPAIAAGARGQATSSGVAVARIVGSVQEVSTTVEASAYHPFIVQKGIPVRWTITVKAADLNSCNNPVTIPAYGVRARLVPGTNVVQFTPDRVGTIAYTCWMGMITSTIQVVDDLASLGTGSGLAATTAAGDQGAPAAQGSIASAFGQAGTGGSCCAPVPQAFAGGAVPTGSIQVARMNGGVQEAVVTVDANGYTPALIVVRKGVKTVIRFDPRALSSCNYLVDFPEYQGRLDLSQGQLETPPLDVTSDFTFQCGMAMLHGYVKVVDDVTAVDLAAVRREVAAYRPAAGAVGSCCTPSR